MRNQEELNKVTEKVKELMAAPSCYSGLKEVCQKWLDSVGTDAEAEAAKTLVEALDECITPIDGLIAFAESEAGTGYFGEEKAKQLASHGKEIKAKGAKYCDCAACAACEALLEQKSLILV